MARILIGIATVTPDQRFLESLPVFFSNARRFHERVEIKWVWNKPLVDAQNEIAEEFLKEDYTHLLFLEDDHWNFTYEMLEACLRTNEPVSAISYRSRHFPFEVIPMKKSYPDRDGRMQYKGFDPGSGIHEADLSGFGFTLIKREVFEKLERPFFRLNYGSGPRATDIDFCQRVQEAGLKIVGIYDIRLPHRDITDEGVKEFLVEGISAKHSMFTRFHQMLIEKRKRNLVGKER